VAGQFAVLLPACQRAAGVVLGINASSASRMDITGARWGLHGAEAVLELRALHANGDWDEYWAFHLANERQRIHSSRYAGNLIPQTA
jgi:hypothetical protein